MDYASNILMWPWWSKVDPNSRASGGESAKIQRFDMAIVMSSSAHILPKRYSNNNGAAIVWLRGTLLFCLCPLPHNAARKQVSLYFASFCLWVSLLIVFIRLFAPLRAHCWVVVSSAELRMWCSSVVWILIWRTALNSRWERKNFEFSFVRIVGTYKIYLLLYLSKLFYKIRL